jgi:hypothetical protein
VRTPVNLQRRIIPANRDLISRAIERVAFVVEISRVRQNGKTVSEPPGYPYLPEVIIAKFNRYMLAECWAADADVDRDVQDAPPHNADKFPLRAWILYVKATEHPTGRP